MTRICVDLSRCEGHGRCYVIAPDLFAPIDDHGHAAFTGDAATQLTAEQSARVVHAIQNCPEEALSWER